MSKCLSLLPLGVGSLRRSPCSRLRSADIMCVYIYIYMLYTYISLSTAPLWFSASAGSGWESPLVSPVSGMPEGWSPGSGRYLTNNLAEVSANWGELDRLRWRIKPRNTVLWTVDTWSGPKNYGEAVKLKLKQCGQGCWWLVVTLWFAACPLRRLAVKDGHLVPSTASCILLSTVKHSKPTCINNIKNDIYTSSSAEGGGASFKNRKPKGEVGGCESRMAATIHWWTERCLERRAICLSICRSVSLSLYLSIDLALHLCMCPSICLSI